MLISIVFVTVQAQIVRLSPLIISMKQINLLAKAMEGNDFKRQRRFRFLGQNLL